MTAPTMKQKALLVMILANVTPLHAAPSFSMGKDGAPGHFLVKAQDTLTQLHAQCARHAKALGLTQEKCIHQALLLQAELRDQDEFVGDPDGENYGDIRSR